MENFCYDTSYLQSISQHYKTGEPMPSSMAKALAAQRHFMRGTDTLRQLHFSELDLLLHSGLVKNAFEIDQELSEKHFLVQREKQDRFLCSFLHIFGGGYSAGYYSYKWSEMYSLDAYAQKNHSKYRDTILANGGALAAQQTWKEFSGRDNVEIIW